MATSSLCDETQNSENWIAVMQLEYDVIMKNGTSSLSDSPPSKKVIGTKWVYIIQSKM